MNEVQINVSQTPSVVLSFRLGESMVFLVVVVPELGDDENLLTLDKAFFDGALDALACFALVLVIICAVEEAVADFDCLRVVNSLAQISLDELVRGPDSKTSYWSLSRRVNSTGFESGPRSWQRTL